MAMGEWTGVLAPELDWEGAKTGRDKVRPDRKEGRREEGGVGRAVGDELESIQNCSVMTLQLC